ncbi:G-protein coupled receptor Mth2-like [Musca autumnalis]|uniref:G-protein coupled receptor Mth2-like n=1 Tax=Musca autumnalis TaxID=221902 RepID=UPI003CF865CB
MHLVKDFYLIKTNLSTICKDAVLLHPEVDTTTGWTLFEDGRLRLNFYDVILNYQEFCFDFSLKEINGRNGFFVDPQVCFNPSLNWHEAFTGYAMLFAVPFFLLTIFCYGCILKIKTDYEKCLILYLSLLSISYSLLGIWRIRKIKFSVLACITVGYAHTFYNMIYLIWNCILCFEIWSRCTSMRRISSYLLEYILVGSIGPLLMTGLIFAAQNIDMPDEYKPGISELQCSIVTTRWSALIYYYAPFTIAVIFSVILFCKILSYIKTTGRDSGHRRGARQMFIISVRLFLLMCYSYMSDVFYILSILIFNNVPLYVMPDILNALQGIVVFYLNVWKPRFFAAVKRKYKKWQSYY